jgi:hypothetical protein
LGATKNVIFYFETQILEFSETLNFGGVKTIDKICHVFVMRNFGIIIREQFVCFLSDNSQNFEF